MATPVSGAKPRESLSPSSGTGSAANLDLHAIAVRDDIEERGGDFLTQG
ncbi:hypothetical protein [Streptomyces sp. NPDC057696]